MNTNIVIFGATGFLGQELVKKFYGHGICITAVARDEGNLISLKERYPNLKIISGDICEKWTVTKAMAGQDFVFCLAAAKHVGLSEIDVQNSTATNVVGMMNILRESVVTKPKVLLLTSTDKAAQPSGVYGCSKKICERLMSEAERVNPATQYRTVRFGNVFGSTGSFITKWIPNMRAGKEVILTDPEATRFFFTVTDAVELIGTCILKAVDSAPYVPEMKAVSMGVVLKACQRVYGDCPVKIIGLQPGENLHETIDGHTFSNDGALLSEDEFIEKFLK